MAFTNRNYRPGETPHYVYNNYNGANKYNQYFYVRTGVIEHVDIDKYQMTVRWTHNDGVRDTVPISFPYSGPAGCIGGLPERGSVGVFGFYNEGTGKGSPLLLSHLPSGLDAGLNHNVVKVFPDSIPTSDINEVNYRFRKLSIGDTVMSSPSGSAMFLNQQVEIQDAAQDTILLREDDQSIISTSVNHFVFADGASVSAGPVMRNSLVVYDSNGKKLQTNGSVMTLTDMKNNVYIVPYGSEITYDTQFYSEYRIDVDELSDGKLDMNDVNSSSPASSRDPVVTMAMGNYIGADRRNPQLYGNNLKVRLFLYDKDQKGQFSLEKAIQTGGVDEPAVVGLAYALHFPKSNCFIGVDKEGHSYNYLPASKANTLGAGRSMSTLAMGNLKEIWGPTADDANSWDLTTKGGIRWNVGSHNANGKNRSIDIKATKGVSIEAGADDDGNALSLKLDGNLNFDLSGPLVLNLTSMTTNINGLKKENVGGSASEIVQSDKSVNVSGVYSETVVKEKQGKFGKRKTTITSGNDELKVLKGDITETITTFGKRKTTITSGNIEQKITTGSHKTTLTTGSYKLNVSTGGIEIKTSAGTIKISGTSIGIEATAQVNVKAPLVKLAKGALIGGVVSGLPGKPNHYDYVTGLALAGSKKVSVG